MKRWERVWLSVVSVGLVAIFLTGAKKATDHRGQILRVKGIEIVDEDGKLWVSIGKFKGEEFLERIKAVGKMSKREIPKEDLDRIANQESGTIQIYSEGEEEIARLVGIKNKEGGYQGLIHIGSTDGSGRLMIMNPNALSVFGKRDEKGKGTYAIYGPDGGTFWQDKEKKKHVFVSEIR